MTDPRLGKENNEVAHLYATQPIGPGLTVPVYPGDTIEMSVKAFHLGGDFSNTTTATALASALASAFTGISGATTEQGLNTAFNDAYGGAIIGNGTGTRPSAYLNYILFDKNMQAQHFGYVQVSELGAEETLSAAIVSDVEGFVFTYVSNESGQVGAEVYFDDFEVTIKESLVVQSTDYYPFGLQHSTSWTRIFDLKNNFLYNAGSELNEKTKIYEMFYRDYDAALGRMTAIDPMAIKYSSLTPYNYSFNDPIAFNDPLGDDPYTGLYGSRSSTPREGGVSDFVWDASEQYGFYKYYGQYSSGRDLSRVTGRSNSLVPYSSMMHSNNYYAQRSMVRSGINKMLKTQWGGSVSSSGTSIAYSGRQQMLNAAGAYARNFSSTALFSALGINYHATSTHDGSGGHIPFLAATLSGTWIGNFNINGLQTGSFEAFNSSDYAFGGSSFSNFSKVLYDTYKSVINSNLMKGLIPIDVITLDGNVSSTFGIGGSRTETLNIMIRGSEPGFYFTSTRFEHGTEGQRYGFEIIDAGFNIGFLMFEGDHNIMRPNDLEGPTASSSGGLGFGINFTRGFDQDYNGTFIGGSVGVGVTAGVSGGFPGNTKLYKNK